MKSRFLNPVSCRSAPLPLRHTLNFNTNMLIILFSGLTFPDE